MVLWNKAFYENVVVTRQSYVQKTISLVLIGIFEKFFQIVEAECSLFNCRFYGSEGVDTYIEKKDLQLFY